MKIVSVFLPIISATVRPLENLPLGKPLPKSMPYQGRLARARLLESLSLLPTSDSESPKMNCTTLQLYPLIAIVNTVTIIANATVNFMFQFRQLNLVQELEAICLSKMKTCVAFKLEKKDLARRFESKVLAGEVACFLVNTKGMFLGERVRESWINQLLLILTKC